MSSQGPSKASGAKDRIVGGAKEAFGNLVGNERLQSEVCVLCLFLLSLFSLFAYSLDSPPPTTPLRYLLPLYS